MGYFCPKNTFVQLKHYIYRIYLTLLSTTCVKSFRLSTARVKIHQIHHVIFQTKGQFFFKAWVTLQRHERSSFCTFLAETLHAIDKKSTSKCKFLDLPLLALKFTKFLMPFLEPRVSFSSNFASLFNVMKHNSSEFFLSKSLYALDKRTQSKCKFLDF